MSASETVAGAADLREPADVLRDAELIHTPAAVAAAFDVLAESVRSRLGDRDPVVLCVMLGGLIPTVRLLQRLEFDLEIDYVHATRYRGDVTGADLEWKAKPAADLRGRAVLVVDDILDEGVTLAAVLALCHERGAAEVTSAVLVDKRIGRPRALERADFTGLEVPNRYVFGCGMDYRDRFRNLPGIYAVRDTGGR